MSMHTTPNTPRTTFTPVMRKKTIKRDPILFIRAKDIKNRESVQKTIKTVLHPTNDPIIGLKNTAKGDIVIQCKDKDSVDKIKQKLVPQASDRFEIIEHNDIDPRIKLINFDEEYLDKAKLCEAIKLQNSDVIDSKSRVKIENVKKNFKNTCIAIISVDYESFKRVLYKKRIKVGWNSCPLFEHVELVRCFNCCRFGHIDALCDMKDTPVCPLCAGTHKLKECDSINNPVKCYNCNAMNEKYNLNLNVNHSALSYKCPTMLKKLKKKKENIQYNEQ